MKRGFLTAVRALVVAICVFLLATVGGFKITSGGAVAVFIGGLAAFWILLERILMPVMQRKKAQKRTH